MKKKPAKKAKPKPVKKSKVQKAAKAKGKAKKTSSKRLSAKAATKAKKAAQSSKSKATAPRSGVIAPINGTLLGYVEDYFAKIGVIALTLQAPLCLGQRIQVLGHTTNLEQAADSMQIDRVPVTQADKKSAVGIKVIGRARRGDHVYLLK